MLCSRCQQRVIAEGTQPGNDFADYTGVQAATQATRDLALATARAEGAIDVLRTLVTAFEAKGFSTPEQQAALRRARALIAETGGDS